MIGHVSPRHKRWNHHQPWCIRSGQSVGMFQPGGALHTHSAPSPAVPGLCTAPLAPALRQAAEPGLQSSAHAGLVCSTSHGTGTKCFVPGLKIGARAQRRLFYISRACECKRCSSKVIFTNVLPIAEFPGLMYHEGATSNASSTPCFKANCDMSLV